MSILNEGYMKIAKRFLDEDLAIHWKVDESRDSFDRLLNYLGIRTNFKPYFEMAVEKLNLNNSSYNLVVADIGAGICWTSAILAQHPNVKFVYAVDPSNNRLEQARFVVKHCGVENKVKIINGSFLEPNIPEKVDLVLLSGSLHHCYNEQIQKFFSNIKQLLKFNGKVLIANEHYVNWIWSLRRLVGYLKNLNKRSELFYSLNNLRAPHPFSGEHWRTRKELLKIFEDNGFVANLYVHNDDLCKDKPHLYQRIGWRYYHAILRPKN